MKCDVDFTLMTCLIWPAICQVLKSHCSQMAAILDITAVANPWPGIWEYGFFRVQDLMWDGVPPGDSKVNIKNLDTEARLQGSSSETSKLKL